VETYGEDIAEENTTYTMDSKLIEKYGEVISDLIYGSKKIADDDKEKLIEAVTSYTVKKGTITKLNEFGGTVQEMIEEVKPVFQMKNIKLEEE
jgi:ABC-type phosphate/phosphonate transport system substrate-binding protein